MSLVKVYGLENALLLLKHIEGYTNKNKVIKQIPLYSSPPIKKGSLDLPESGQIRGKVLF